MEQPVLATLDAWIEGNDGRVVSVDEFPFGTLSDVAEERDLPVGSALRILATLEVKVTSTAGSDGQVDRRRTSVAKALGACFSDLDLATPWLIGCLADSPPVAADGTSDAAADADADEGRATAVRGLAHACVNSLERLQAPPSPEYEGALAVAQGHTDIDLERDVEYAYERLRSTRLRPVRERVSLAMSEAVTRLATQAQGLGPTRNVVLREATLVFGWLAGIADGAYLEPPDTGTLPELDDRALLDGIVEDLSQVAPDAFGSGGTDLKAARALMQALAEALGGDAEAAAQLEAQRRELVGDEN